MSFHTLGNQSMMSLKTFGMGIMLLIMTYSKHKSSVALILYQDAFEVVNPLGSARKKHKILAVYLTLGDILPCNRSNIDHMQHCSALQRARF